MLKPRADFPLYQIGSDVDLLVSGPLEFAIEHIFEIYNKLYDTKYLTIDSYYYHTSHHIDIRIKENNMLLLKFDLITDFSKFKNVEVKPILVEVMDRLAKEKDGVLVLPYELDLLMRYLLCLWACGWPSPVFTACKVLTP